VHDWLTSGVLPARRVRGGHWAITFTPDIEAACQQRLAASGHIHRDADDVDRQPGENSIAQTAARLGVQADVVYYSAQRGLPAHPTRQERPPLGHAHPRPRGTLPPAHRRLLQAARPREIPGQTTDHVPNHAIR
jgi:hypothetical protein